MHFSKATIVALGLVLAGCANYETQTRLFPKRLERNLQVALMLARK